MEEDFIARFQGMSLGDLQVEVKSIRDSKRVLQKQLKDFEHDFERREGNFHNRLFLFTLQFVHFLLFYFLFKIELVNFIDRIVVYSNWDFPISGLVLLGVAAYMLYGNGQRSILGEGVAEESFASSACFITS